MIPTFVMNLERDHDRRTTMAARLDALKIPHTFLKGVDGRILTPDELRSAAARKKMTYPATLMPTSNGCDRASRLTPEPVEVTVELST